MDKTLINFNKHWVSLRPDLSRESIDEVHRLKEGIFPSLILASSGTSFKSEESIFFINHSSMVEHAKIINQTFKIDSKSRILQVLPLHFMGGASAHYRSQVSGAEEVFSSQKWCPLFCQNVLKEERITHVSLVPTQLYDLVKAELFPPVSLETVFVGGDSLSPIIRERAVELGWPINESYGMTEFCSQIATGLTVNGFKVLPFYKFKFNENSVLSIKSPYHFDFKLIGNKGSYKMKSYESFLDSDGYFPTEDFAKSSEGCLEILGRVDDFVKINGKFYNLKKMELSLDSFIQQAFYLFSSKGGRSGSIIHLVHSGSSLDKVVLENLKKHKISKVWNVSHFIKTQSQKIMRIQPTRANTLSVSDLT